MSKKEKYTIGKLWRGISAKRQEAIYDHVVAEYKPTLIRSLTETIREQVEDDLREKLEAEALVDARQEAKEELAAQKPTPKQREAFRLFVQETEVDCQAQAVVASAGADRTTKRLSWARRFRGVLASGLFLGLWPALYGVFRATGSQLSIELAFAALTLLTTLLVVVRSNRKRFAQLEAEAKRLYKIASNYLVLTERAKSFRIVHAEKLETKKRIAELTSQLRKAKNELDHAYHPSVKDLDEARESVRHRIITQTPVSLRIEDDFEERLAEAQADAAEVETARVGS